MPDISASLGLLDATFFLYENVEAARAGEGYGGTGVLVGIPAEGRPDLHIRYAVSNWHVAVHQGFSVIRLNLPGGGVHVVELDPSEWTFLPGKQDLAAVVLSLPRDFDPPIVPEHLFIKEDANTDTHVGDDVFMVGRFVDFDGHETNKPATRFGFISMMDAPIKQKTGFRGRSIILDMHSRSGFSGSPVYVYRPGSHNVTRMADGSLMSFGPTGLGLATHRKWGTGNNVEVRLLGLHWGQFPEKWQIGAEAPKAEADASLVTDGAYVAGFSGMTCVIPANQILELLNHPELAVYRKGPFADAARAE